MNVAHVEEDLVVSDLRRAVVIDFRREALCRVVGHANLLGGAVDRVLNEGEQAVDRLTQLSIDRRSRVEVEDSGDRVAHHGDVEPMDVHAKAAALDRERVGVKILCPPPLARGIEIGSLWPGANGVAARNRESKQRDAGNSK